MLRLGVEVLLLPVPTLLSLERVPRSKVLAGVLICFSLFFLMLVLELTRVLGRELP